MKLPKDMGAGDKYLSIHFDGFDAGEQRFKPNALTAFRNGLYCPFSFSESDGGDSRRPVLVSSRDGDAERTDELLERLAMDLLAVLREALMNVAVDVHNIRPLGGDDRFIHGTSAGFMLDQ